MLKGDFKRKNCQKMIKSGTIWAENRQTVSYQKGTFGVKNLRKKHSTQNRGRRFESNQLQTFVFQIKLQAFLDITKKYRIERLLVYFRTLRDKKKRFLSKYFSICTSQ